MSYTKRILSILTVLVIMLSIISCNKSEGIEYTEGENSVRFSLTGFCGEYKLKVRRTDLGEGAIYYNATLGSGSICVSYDTKMLSGGELFKIDSYEQANGSGGYVEGSSLYIIIAADEVSYGTVIISFEPLESDHIPYLECVSNQTDTFRFLGNDLPYSVSGSSKDGKYVGLEVYTFKRYYGPVTLNIPSTRISFYAGTLFIYSPKIFSFVSNDGMFYEINSDSDFSNLFGE